MNQSVTISAVHSRHPSIRLHRLRGHSFTGSFEGRAQASGTRKDRRTSSESLSTAGVTREGCRPNRGGMRGRFSALHFTLQSRGEGSRVDSSQGAGPRGFSRNTVKKVYCVNHVTPGSDVIGIVVAGSVRPAIGHHHRCGLVSQVMIRTLQAEGDTKMTSDAFRPELTPRLLTVHLPRAS